MIDYKEIFKAWKASFKPTTTQEELAKKRLSICLGCEHRKEVLKGVEWSAVCGKCGCPLNKKVFSQNFSPCPMGKWEIVDSQYIKSLESKKKNSLI